MSVFGHQNPGSGIQPKMLDPDPDPNQMNADPQPCFKFDLFLHGLFPNLHTLSSQSLLTRKNSFTKERLPPLDPGHICALCV